MLRRRWTPAARRFPARSAGRAGRAGRRQPAPPPPPTTRPCSSGSPAARAAAARPPAGSRPIETGWAPGRCSGQVTATGLTRVTQWRPRTARTGRPPPSASARPTRLSAGEAARPPRPVSPSAGPGQPRRPPGPRRVAMPLPPPPRHGATTVRRRGRRWTRDEPSAGRRRADGRIDRLVVPPPYARDGTILRRRHRTRPGRPRGEPPADRWRPHAPATEAGRPGRPNHLCDSIRTSGYRGDGPSSSGAGRPRRCRSKNATE